MVVVVVVRVKSPWVVGEREGRSLVVKVSEEVRKKREKKDYQMCMCV